MSRRIKMTVSYDGTDFCGWQRQASDRTVQGEIETVLKEMGEPEYGISGAGRTDSGVHALGQVFHFDSSSPIPPERYHLALNSRLPHDVRILDSRMVHDDFHSRYDAVQREYRYYIFSGGVCPPFYRRICHYVRQSLDVDRLNELAAQVIGVHDFTTFAAARDPSKNKVREVFQSEFYREGPFIVYRIRGNAFLWKMVRSILGSIIQILTGELKCNDMKSILESRDRIMAGDTIPSKGLILYQVDYNKDMQTG